MYGGKTTLYEILGVARDAKVTDVGRAYNKFRAEQQDETVAPDHRRAALVREAYEILSDPVRREAYDQSLRAPQVLIGRAAARINFVYVGMGFAAAIIVAVAYFATRPEAHPWDRNKSPVEIANLATLAISRLHGIEMSGETRPIGLAFAISEGVLATSCQGITPGMELVVQMASRKVSARVMMADDARGLCKLAAGNVGSWPLAFSGGDPRPGEKVYATRVNAQGEASLKEATVRRLVPEANGMVVETSIAVPPEARGGPLLDLMGKVVAVASPSTDGKQQRYISVPASWIAQAKAPPPVPVAPAAVPEEAPAAAASSATGDPSPKKGPKISKERQERLEKAFRPPPTVPDEL
jgi:DnaJ domain